LKDSERHEIAILLHKGHSLRSIAQTLSRSVSTISDEIARNKVGGVYDAKKAIHKAYVNRKDAKYQGMKIVDHKALRHRVEELLLEGRSPESIAGRITHKEKHLPSISGDSILRFLKSVHGRSIVYERSNEPNGSGARDERKSRSWQTENSLMYGRQSSIGVGEWVTLKQTLYSPDETVPEYCSLLLTGNFVSRSLNRYLS
jgi:IS30 family transposase